MEIEKLVNELANKTSLQKNEYLKKYLDNTIDNTSNNTIEIRAVLRDIEVVEIKLLSSNIPEKILFKIIYNSDKFEKQLLDFSSLDKVKINVKILQSYFTITDNFIEFTLFSIEKD